MKDVCTHSGNPLRELYHPASHRNISDRGQLAHNSKGFATRLCTFPHVERCIQGMDQNNTVGYVYCEKCLYKQVVWNFFRMKQGYSLDLPPMQSTHKCVQCLEDGVHGKGSIWDE